MEAEIKLKKRPLKQALNSYDEYLSTLSPERLEEFERGYQAELLSELMHAMMKQDNISVRELAKAAGISPTIIQEIKTRKKSNITLLTAAKIASSLKHKIVFIPDEKAKS